MFTKTHSDDILQLPYHPAVNMMPRYAPKYIALVLRIPKKVSYVRLGWQKYHQDIQFPPF